MTVNLKKGHSVLVKNDEYHMWNEAFFDHFFEGIMYAKRDLNQHFALGYKMWKLPDPPKPEKKEYWVNWYGSLAPACYESLEMAVKNQLYCIQARLHITCEEGKLPVVEVIQPY